MSGRVRIGTCANPADAALVRSVFAAFGVDVLIAAEHHASLLGSVGSNFLSLDIWVDAADAEDATALLRDMRENGRTAPGDASADAASDRDPAAEAPGAETDAEAEAATADVRLRTLRRRRAGVAILLGCFVSFGTAHMAVGAWRRGIALAVFEFLGWLQILKYGAFGPLVVIVAIGIDVIGALALIRAAGQPALPPARIRR